MLIYILDKKRITFLQVRNFNISGIPPDRNTSEAMMYSLSNIKNRNFIFKEQLPDFCRLILRNYAWAKLYSLNMFVHFGYDYYMYAGFSGACRGLTKKAKELGLFIERFKSPY